MTGAGTVTITGAIDGMTCDAGLRSAVTQPKHFSVAISSRVFFSDSDLPAFMTAVRGAIPPTAG